VSDMINDSCANPDEHSGHKHILKVVSKCDGMSPCGAQLHSMHLMSKDKYFWCNGVCNCGLDGDIKRGPGRHK